ncbi:MAG: glycosyltransferase family 2 protein [Syntrophales bacterium]
MTAKVPLSVAIITRNEGENLPGCLKSVLFASQVVVVDSGSTDDTIRIAKETGCQVCTHGWEGFGVQKQFAIEQCTQPWILVLDADERIPPDTAATIREIVTRPEREEDPAGYTFPRRNYFQGRWIRHNGWWPDRILRLFRRGSGRMSSARVHEGLEVKGLVAPLEDPIDHFTESRLSAVLQKIDRYSTLGALEAFEDGKRSTVWAAFFRACFTFLQGYFLRLGMLDGVQGLTLAMTDSVNKFFKYAKLSELSRQQDRVKR